MKSLRFLDRRAGYSLASLGLLLGMIVPSVFPAFASAAGQLDSRSITMSSSIADAGSVKYELRGTTEGAITAAGGLVIQFCGDSPLIGLACAHPTGLDVTAVSANTGTATDIDPTNHSIIQWVAGGSGVGAGDPIDVVFSGIHNPSGEGAFYARVTTYNAAPDFTSATLPGTVADQGSVALATTQAIGVTAYVREAMTFCVSGQGPLGVTPAPGPACGTTGQAVVSPSMTLGEGTPKALDSGHVSTGTDYAQLSTNAAGGAVVNLQSNTAGCGGLIRAGATNCDIKPQNTSGQTISLGQALFGLTVGSSTDVLSGANPSGLLDAESPYDGSNYFLDYDASNTDATGVTSTYGSPLFSSTGPVNQQYVPIEFGASIQADTPAGIYGATLNMIATGTF